MFCQACGAKNAEGSRFCNLCGARFAAVGEPGGPVRPEPAAAAPPVDVWSLTPGAADKGSDIQQPERVGSKTMQSAGIAVHRKRNMVLMIAGATTLLAAAFLLGRFAAPAAAPTDDTSSGRPIPETSATDATPNGSDPPLFTGTPEVHHTKARAARAAADVTPRGGARSAQAGSLPLKLATNARQEDRPLPLKLSGTAQANRNGTAPATIPSTNAQPEASSGGANTNRDGTDGTAPARSAIDHVPAEEVDEDETTIEEEMYAVQVRRVIRTYYLPRAQSCFDHQSRVSQDSVRGTVLVTFSIQASGEVQDATVTRNTTNNEALGRCLASAVNQWRLPAPPSAPLELAMPFGR